MPLAKTLVRACRPWWMQTALCSYAPPGSTTTAVIASQSHSTILLAPPVSHPLLLPSMAIRHPQSTRPRNSTIPAAIRQKQRHYSSSTSSHTTTTTTAALDVASTSRTPLKIINPRKDDNGNDMLLTITPRAVEVSILAPSSRVC